MTWYCASLITAIVVPDAADGGVGVFEDFVMVEAETREEAWESAMAAGRSAAAIEDGLTYAGKPARREFLGVRKLRSIYLATPGRIDEHPPDNGSEVSHSYFEVASIDVARAMARGERVSVEYVDDAE